MLDWLRKRPREEDQLEKLVDDIESPADPDLAAGDEEHTRSAKNSAWAAAIAAIVAIALVVAAIAVVISLRGGRPA